MPVQNSFHALSESFKLNCFRPESILYPLKKRENQRFSGVFQGYQVRTLVRNGLKTTTQSAFTFFRLTITTPERRQWRRSCVFIVNFEYISHLVLVFLLLTLSM